MWGFEGNILAVMFKPVYEDPVDTIEEVIARGLIPVTYNWGLQERFEQSGNQLYQDLAKIIVVAKDNEEYNNLIWDQVLGNATHVLLANSVADREFMKRGNLFHFSQEVIEGFNPYTGWIQNKLFHLNDELAKHILIYQQVCWVLFNYF